MNLTDLRIFASAARLPSLGAAALALHLTPSAVSKALRRLEDSLGKPLFDRGGKQLVLNDSGRLLLERAHTLLALADQARTDLMGERAAVDCRVGGPAILLWRHGPALARALSAYPQGSLRLQSMFEDEALAALARGDVDAAIVTGDVVGGRHWREQWQATPLGGVTLQLMAGAAHPLVRRLEREQRGELRASTAEVLAHDFACPSRSLFCGVQKGTRSDGWRDDQLPRTIRYWADDLQLLLSLVTCGAALAYLPDFALAASQSALRRIHVHDCAFACVEQVALVWRPGQAGDWLRRTVETLHADPDGHCFE